MEEEKIFNFHEFVELTEKEKSEQKISYKRLKELIEKCDRVAGSIIDYNSWGLFHFIDLIFGENCLVCIGHGLNEFSEQYEIDPWKLFNGLVYPQENETVNKIKLLKKLDEDHKKFIQARAKQPIEKSEKVKLYLNLIKELGSEIKALNRLRELEIDTSLQGEDHELFVNIS